MSTVAVDMKRPSPNTGQRPLDVESGRLVSCNCSLIFDDKMKFNRLTLLLAEQRTMLVRQDRVALFAFSVIWSHIEFTAYLVVTLTASKVYEDLF